MKTERYLERAWHDENLKITNWGLVNMRLLILVGWILGMALGGFIAMLVYESLG